MTVKPCADGNELEPYGVAIHQAKQESWKDGQLSIFDYITLTMKKQRQR
mgnify:CR=1 FL=1